MVGSGLTLLILTLTISPVLFYFVSDQCHGSFAWFKCVRGGEGEVEALLLAEDLYPLSALAWYCFNSDGVRPVARGSPTVPGRVAPSRRAALRTTTTRCRSTLPPEFGRPFSSSPRRRSRQSSRP